jgi:Membrane bound beta barrel domain (DUF5777)
MKHLLLILVLTCFCSTAIAQDDLSALLDSATNQRENISATFKSSRIINVQTNETVSLHTLDFRVAHRFGSIGKASGGNRHNLYGIDESSDIRVAFEYGITERLTIGVARHKYNENYEVLGKFRLLEQTNDDHIPVAVTIFSNAAYSDDQNPLFNSDTVSSSTENLRRLSYTTQIIIARKFSPGLSLQILPTVVHHNFVFNPNDDNTIYALGVGGRIKVTRSMAIIADYMYNFSELRKINNDNGYYNALGAGVEFETGGHVFSLKVNM